MEKKLKVTVILDGSDKTKFRAEVEGDVMSPDEMVRAGMAAIKVVSRGVLEKLNDKEKKSFFKIIFKFFKALEKERK